MVKLTQDEICQIADQITISYLNLFDKFKTSKFM